MHIKSRSMHSFYYAIVSITSHSQGHDFIINGLVINGLIYCYKTKKAYNLLW